MNGFHKGIKYGATAFAMLLAIGIIGTIITVILSIVSAFDIESGEKIDITKEFNEVDNIDTIEIDIANCSLEIIEGDTISVEAKQVEKDFKLDLSGKTLKIGEDNKEWFQFFNWSNKQGSVIVTLPSGYIAKEFDINTGVGKVNISNLHTEKLKLDAGTGSVVGKNITVTKESKIDTGTGSIELSDISMANVRLDTGTGSVYYEGELLGRNKIDTGTGSVELSIKGRKEDYYITVDSGSGKTYLNDSAVSRKYRSDNSNAQNSIDIDSGTGSVYLNFLE